MADLYGDQWYTLSFKSRDGYLYCFVKGHLTAPDTRIEAWREIIDRCREDDWENLLVVQDSPGNPTPADAFTSSAGITALGLSGIKIAFVDLDPMHHETNQLGEIVAKNRGAFAKVFTREDDALAFLRS